MRISLILLLSIGAFGADSPQWRGINRDGKSPETGLLKSWPAGGPKKVFTAEGLGEGFSSFAVVNGRMYTQGQRGGQEFVIALDAATGKKLWEHATGRSFNESRGNGPRGTPTIDGNRLYAVSADGTLVCLETADGKEVWRINFGDQFGAGVLHWGMSESPLVEGDRVYVVPGGRAGVVALNKSNAHVIWKSEGAKASYSSLIAFDAGGRRILATLAGNGAVGLTADKGELLWKFEKVVNNVANIATPVYHDGQVFYSSDYGTGCLLVKVTADGGVRGSEVYFNREMRNHYGTSVLVDGTLYGYSSAILTAMDFKTGNVLWRNRAVGKGSCIYAEGHLYCIGEDGTVGLVKASPANYLEVSRFDFPHGEYKTWTPLVIANGRLYVRDQDKLFCYDIKM